MLLYHVYHTEVTVYFSAFNGESYIEHPVMDFSSTSTNSFYVSFKTTAHMGTVLYSAASSGEFIHLFVDDGNLKYQASCGERNVLFIASRIRVNHDNLTTVDVQ